MTNASPAPSRSRPMLASFAGWRPSSIGADLIAGLSLAAIAVPSQMATARLGRLSPEIGLLALVAGAVGFALFGANRVLAVGADSTIAPIFAGALVLLPATAGSEYSAAAAALALSVGSTLILAGVFRLGFIADLLSIPVTTGFLAGIAVHIIMSQAPALLGVAAPPGSILLQIAALGAGWSAINPYTMAIGFGVLAITLIGEKLSPRAPAALFALALATALTAALHLDARGVTTLGAIAGIAPTLSLLHVTLKTLFDIAPLTLVVSVVVMVQTAATTRSFVSDPVLGPDVDADFIGVGAANLMAGLIGAFPVNASPPSTAVVAESGGVSQVGALVSAALALALAAYGGDLLARVPNAALAGMLLFVAQHIVRVEVMRDVWRRGASEFALIVATMLAIVVFPIEEGVGVGILLSILHGVWTTTRARVVELECIPGTSIWWPKSRVQAGETVPGIHVIALQAPLSFLNAYKFQQALQSYEKAGTRLVIIEANAIVEIDYTGAKVLSDAVQRLRAAGVDVAFARLESVRARESFARQGLEALVGADHLFHSVAEAVAARGEGRTP